VALTTVPLGSHLEILGHIVPLQIVNFDAGIMLALAFIGLEVYPIILAGWSSNNKYSMMGAIRGSSQIVSYEISMGMALLSMLIVYGTFDMTEMVRFQQTHIWGCFINPIAALVFWVCIFAETNRLPFDLPEGEAEIVAGFHLEYGAMKFALFFMAEYVAMIMASLFLSTVFFGGFALLPGFSLIVELATKLLNLGPANSQNLLALFEFLSLFLKGLFFMFVFVWVRWTLPRFRFDQLMELGWKILFPLSLVNLIFMCIVSYFMNQG
jgi:NADH-quinone oxidoreductase subunit H